jgi:hypothetical protein
MSWIITGSQPIPAVIGEPFGGGYFAGYISHTADGNPTHALIVAPKATGEAGSLQWKTANTQTSGTSSVYDGVANTAAMVAAGINDHPAAKFCTELTIGGFTDWYLPSRDELNIAYFNLKPTTALNTSNKGANLYAVPQRPDNWTTDYPAQTYVADFASGGAQFFAVASLFMSTETNATTVWGINFSTGNTVNDFTKTTALTVRAFRRIAL